MARRFTAEEKGKAVKLDLKEPQIKRIRAPPLDTTALIEENSRTLIGRLTNPREQRLWALIPSLPRKWNSQGRVIGSDLGNNCFQFRFEKEEDLQRVLDNRPYHFGYWMVILERWKPIIADTFPSSIPFWIKIKGLPLHFWHEDLICRIGRELGSFEKHELTKTSARVRVSVNGLKPLLKETIVEFDTGEESKITLEYERLENHCTICLLLSHRSEQCPSRSPETAPQEHTLREEARERTLPQQDRSHQKESSYYQDRKPSPRRKLEDRQESRKHNDFNMRVDRHGRAFGDRLAIRHTRNPPPPRDDAQERPLAITSQKYRGREEIGKQEEYKSPQYSRKRRHHPYGSYHRRPLFPSRDAQEWRRKESTAADQEVNSPILTQNQQATKTPLPGSIQQQETSLERQEMREQILEDINRTTQQYLNCDDPSEAAARKIRVLASEKNGLVEEAVESMLASRIPLDVTERQRRQQTQLNNSHSRDQVMEELQNVTLQYLSCADPKEARARQLRVMEGDAQGQIEEVAEGILAATSLNPVNSDSAALAAPTQRRESPPPVLLEIIPLTELQTGVLMIEEGQSHQEKSDSDIPPRRRRRKESPRARTVNISPNVLLGASSRKRNISSMKFSPARRSPTIRVATQTHANASGTSNQGRNPPIQLIPASSKRKEDFRDAPPRVP